MRGKRGRERRAANPATDPIRSGDGDSHGSATSGPPPNGAWPPDGGVDGGVSSAGEATGPADHPLAGSFRGGWCCASADARACSSHCPCRKPPFWAVGRAARPFKRAMQTRFTTENARAA